MKQMLVSLFLVSLLASCAAKKELATANAQIATLNSQVESLTSQLNTEKQQVAQLAAQNTQYKKEAADCQEAKAAVAERFNRLNESLAEQGTSLEEIRRKAARALEGFRQMGANVEYKNGFVVISMADELAFPSGGTDLSVAGEQVMSVVADAMHEFKNITAIVVGNTDDVPVKKTYKDNWSLSTERANSVVRVLFDKYGVDPDRLTAAGRSEYFPVADNSTAEGRAKNRRIEVLLNPKLDKLWELSKSGK